VATGRAQKDPDGRIGDFADGSPVLRSDADGGTPLLDDARFIDDDHAIGVAEGVSDHLLVALDDGLDWPGTLANEVLQIADSVLLGDGDALSGFARLVAEQAVEIDISPGGLFGAAEGRSKGGVKGGKGVKKALNIAWGDGANGGWSGSW
jgi:hypothetical protein